MTVQRVGAGGLIKFVTSGGEFDFVLGRSKRSGLNLSAPTTHSVAANGLFRVDRAGTQLVPLDLVLQYEYLIAPVTTLHSVQTQWDSLYQLWIANQVGVLITFAVGDSTDLIAGQARIENIVELDNEPNHMRLNITFFAEAGMVS